MTISYSRFLTSLIKSSLLNEDQLFGFFIFMSKPSNLLKKTALTSLTLGLLVAGTFARPHILDSANLTNTKDTLQSSRLSYAAEVGTGTTVGTSTVYVRTSGNSAPRNSVTTANLHSGDSLTIGSNTYTITGIIDATTFNVTPVLLAGDADVGDVIYLKNSPRHVVSFTTATAVADGYFRILIPADATNPNDGNPDDGGFDFGGGTVDVVAPDVGSGATRYDFVTGVATASGGTGCTTPANYHCFEVHYSGNGSIGANIVINIGNTNGTNSIMAPAEATGHTDGTADTYIFQARQYNATNTLVDQTNASIAVIESVRVTVTVDPTITFTIAGINTGTSACGANPDVDTTAGTNAPLAVPFGSVSLNTFRDAAHNLTVSTNAQYGYAVTAIEDDELGKDGGTSPFIPDTDCDGEDCSTSASTEWNTGTDNGFGYSLQNIDAAAITFEYDDSARTFNARPFPNAADTDSPVTLFSSSTVANAENAYVCYRVSVGATQQAGDYENLINYNATATF